MPHMYILECADGSYYTGSTRNLEVRLSEHQNGLGARHTAKRLPVKLVYCEFYERVEDAFHREKQVQGWSRLKKQALIEEHPEKLIEYARNYSQYPRRLASTSSATGEGVASTSSATGEAVASTSSVTGEGLASTSSATGEAVASTSSVTGEGLASTSSATGEGLASTSSATGEGLASTSSATGEGLASTSSATGEGLASTSSATGETLPELVEGNARELKEPEYGG